MHSWQLPAWRFYLLGAAMLLMLVALVARLATLQLLSGERGAAFLQDQLEARVVRLEEIPAYRGVITDRNGEPLAVSTPLTSIWADPSVLVNYPQYHDELGELVGIPAAELSERIERVRTREFMYLKRKLTPAEADEVLSRGIPGVYGQTEYQRYYPAGEVTAHLLGFTNVDDAGQEGIELGFDQLLSGESGYQRVVKDLRGRIIEDLGIEQPVRPGVDLQLTIDLRMQYLLYKELKAGVAAHRASNGAGVILDAHTGEIMAMASQPAYNPNNRATITADNLRNRVLVDTFEPGSTMKPLTMITALESGNYTPETEINTHPGWMVVNGKTLKDPLNYGVLDLTGILRKSSQIGTTRIALTLEPEALFDVFSRVRLGLPSAIGFPGEAGGYLPMPGKSDISRANYAFGYGMSITAIQLARAYAAIANDGMLVEPLLVRGMETTPPERVIDEQIAQQVREMMVSVTEQGGTGTRAAVPNYRVAGKTGTTHLVGSSGYQRDRYRALFGGMIPADDPRYVMVVVIGDPQTVDYGGGAVAAPVFGRVMDSLVRIAQIRPDNLPGQLAGTGLER